EGLRADPRIAAVDRRLRRQGWLSIASLRMVPAVPFSVLNYAAALSSVRFRHFLPATVLGSAPGTVAAILLGQALTAGGAAAARRGGRARVGDDGACNPCGPAMASPPLSRPR